MATTDARNSLARRKPSKNYQNFPIVTHFYTHKAVRDRVLARAIAGQTKTQIAQEEKLSRPTVRKILNLEDKSRLFEQQRFQIMKLAQAAVNVYEHLIVDKNDSRAATQVLVAAGIIPKELADWPRRRRTQTTRYS